MVVLPVCQGDVPDPPAVEVGHVFDLPLNRRPVLHTHAEGDLSLPGYSQDIRDRARQAELVRPVTGELADHVDELFGRIVGGPLLLLRGIDEYGHERGLQSPLFRPRIIELAVGKPLRYVLPSFTQHIRDIDVRVDDDHLPGERLRPGPELTISCGLRVRNDRHEQGEACKKFHLSS